MNAAIWTEYGYPEGVEIQEIENPVPKANEILIKVKAASLSKADWEMRIMDFPAYIRFPIRLYVGLSRPKRVRILGQEVAGIVEAIGKNVTRFSPGDEVMASTGIVQGGHAEYVCVPENGEENLIAHKPANISFEQAACIPSSGIEAYCFLKRAELSGHQKVMIIGAGGSFGSFAVQLVKAAGAECTAVDAGAKSEYLLHLGADKFIDFSKSDYSDIAQKYDVIFDIVCKVAFPRVKHLLAKSGGYLAGNPKLGHLLRSSRQKKPGAQFIFPHSGKHRIEDLDHLKALVEQDKLSIVVDKVFDLKNIAEAYQYAVSGAKQGNIVLRCSM